MARIPTKYDLSGPVSQNSGRAIATYDVASGIARGAQGLAAGLADIGSAMVNEQQRELQQRNAVDIARAEAESTRGLLDLENSYQNDPDYSTFSKRGNPAIDKAYSSAASLIRDPKMRENWAARKQEEAIRAKDWLTDQARIKRQDAEVTALDEANRKNYDIVIDPNTPEDVRDKTRKDIEANIAMNEKSGLLSPAEAAKRRALFVEKSYDDAGILAAESGKLNLPDVDELTRAMVDVESQGDHTAVSEKGAVGLMQIKPETAADIARELGDRNFPTDPAQQAEYLKDPNVSLTYGKRYMGDLLSRYKGDEEAALIAYNGGMARADKWLESGRDDSVLPDETASYYKKVLRGAGPQARVDPQQVGAARSYLQAHTDKDASHINGLKGDFAVKLSNLLQSAPPEIRDKLGVLSGARSTEHQRELWQAALKKYGSVDEARRWVAPPGRSNHNHGLAADLSYDGKSLRNAPPEVVAWLHDNAGKYGLSFPLANENWHIEDAGARSRSSRQYPAGWDKMSPEGRQKATALWDARRRADETARLALIKADQQQAKDDFNLLIATNPNRLTQTDILNNSVLDNGDKATLINSLKTALKENEGVSEFISALGTGQSVSINPFSDDQTKIADKGFEQMLAATSEDKRPLLTGSVIAQTGYVPKMVQAEIRRGMASQTVPEMAQSLATVDNIQRLAPASIASMTGHQEVEKNLTAYRHYMFDMGYSQEEAARKVIALNDPALVQQREAVMKSKPVTDFLKDVDTSTVSGIYDKAFSFAPDVGQAPTQQQLSVGYNPESEATIVADYKSILEESVADAGGDTDLGKKMADERFKRLYGPSKFTMAGDSSIAKLPPELAYPADINGSHDYIREQAIEDLKGEGISASEVYLQPYDQTDRDVSAGKPANYQVFYMKDGQLQKYQHPFTFDPGKANETAVQKSKERQKENLGGMLEQERRLKDAGKRKEGSPDFIKALEIQNEYQRMQDERRRNEKPASEPAIDNGDGGEMPATDAMGNPL